MTLWCHIATFWGTGHYVNSTWNSPLLNLANINQWNTQIHLQRFYSAFEQNRVADSRDYGYYGTHYQIYIYSDKNLACH